MALPPEVVGLADVLVPSAQELALLAGAQPPGNLDATIALARKLAEGTDVIVTLGADGALLVGRTGSPILLFGTPDVDVTDTTGAGDCFCGTLAVSLAQGRDLADAARLSVAAASISTTARGARGKLPGQREAELLSARLAVTTIQT